MKAVFCEELGGPEKLVVRDIDPPGKPGQGQIKVAIKARSISFADTLRIQGKYQVKETIPFIVGGESSGFITEIGAGVAESHPSLKVGDLVNLPGGCVEEILIKASQVTPLPKGIDPENAATFLSSYSTSYYALDLAQLKPGETLLVHGAAGGVGQAAVDLGKLMGATVIATASTKEKLAVAKQSGADHVINYSKGFREEVLALTNGLGADVVYDPVGGDVFDESIRCTAPFGRILVVGFAGGRPALAKTNHLLVKDISVIGFTLGGVRKYKLELLIQQTQVLLGWLASGHLKPHISHRVPLEKTSEAFQLIIDREVKGKVVIV
ncbi:MAG: NADPH:quinone oxidoreductase family protein [Pseudomonadales bacterium]|nr:NADPH:quinone oxidoreductase family protein [Pseudomonadales bacterium]